MDLMGLAVRGVLAISIQNLVWPNKGNNDEAAVSVQ